MVDCQIQGYIKSLKYEGTSWKSKGTFQVWENLKKNQVYISSMRELLKSVKNQLESSYWLMVHWLSHHCLYEAGLSHHWFCKARLSHHWLYEARLSHNWFYKVKHGCIFPSWTYRCIIPSLRHGCIFLSWTHRLSSEVQECPWCSSWSMLLSPCEPSSKP